MGKNKTIPFEKYNYILNARRAGMSTTAVCEAFNVSETVVKLVWRNYHAAVKGDLAALERQKNGNPRIYRWALRFLPAAPQQDQQMSINDWTPEPGPLPAPALGLTAAEITETTVELFAKSIAEDGENADFLRGVIALYKALHAPGAEM